MRERERKEEIVFVQFLFFLRGDLYKKIKKKKKKKKKTHLSQLAANVATSPCVAEPSTPCAASTASADAHTSAAEDDSPEPSGTVPWTRTSSEHGAGAARPLEAKNSKTPL